MTPEAARRRAEVVCQALGRIDLEDPRVIQRTSKGTYLPIENALEVFGEDEAAEVLREAPIFWPHDRRVSMLPANGVPRRQDTTIFFLCDVFTCLWVRHHWTSQQLSEWAKAHMSAFLEAPA